MSRYALWNNKGGVGKTFLTFALSCEYALAHPDEEVIVLDLCPQANLTEMLLGGRETANAALEELYNKSPRCSVGGYFEARLTSPFVPLSNIDAFLIRPCEVNAKVPSNLLLLPGDNLLELLAEAIRQVSQMPLPPDAWRKIMGWLSDLVRTYSEASGASDIQVFIDCNPSFSIYTQIGLCTADNLIIPFTADDSSRRGIENVFALLYGIASEELAGYARLSFIRRANDEGVELPKLHTFVSNRATMFRGKPSSAFQAKSAPIKAVVESNAKSHKRYFASHRKSEDLFVEMPDYHSVAVVASSEGCPLSTLKSGHHPIDDDIVQVNQSTIDKYKKAMSKLVERL
jgi:cellulose biosynthesis protein BcsQ